jgi:hypothetical protein
VGVVKLILLEQFEPFEVVFGPAGLTNWCPGCTMHYMFDLEVEQIKKELEKEESSWPQSPSIQGQLTELERKVQALKKALSSSSAFPRSEALMRLSESSRAGFELSAIHVGLARMAQRRPILRNSVQILRRVLSELEEFKQELRFYIDFCTYSEAPGNQPLCSWVEARREPLRQQIKQKIKDWENVLIVEGGRASAQEDLLLARASMKMAVEVLSREP